MLDREAILARLDKLDEYATSLREHRIITDDLAARFEGIVGFRNILVHEYIRIDRDIVYQSLHSHTSDLGQFAEQIVALLKSRQS